MKLDIRALIVQVVALLCLVPAVMLIVQNWPVFAPIYFGQVHWTAVSTGSMMLLVSVLISISLLVRVFYSVQGLQQTVRRFEIRREQAEASSEASGDTVKALEAKIQTLEIALEKALSRSGQA